MTPAYIGMPQQQPSPQASSHIGVPQRGETKAAKVLQQALRRFLAHAGNALDVVYRITRQCLEVLRDAGYRVMILTRAARITDDLELIGAMDGAAVGFSIPTDDDSYRSIFEPGADPVEDRIRAIVEELRDDARPSISKRFRAQPS